MYYVSVIKLVRFLEVMRVSIGYVEIDFLRFVDGDVKWINFLEYVLIICSRCFNFLLFLSKSFFFRILFRGNKYICI